ncbi:recombinase family protein [Acaryochloris marina]|uniref:recombinase family protein n=1 Tax=Acaryochloris marina TaxID=155978 RepID=UPI001BAFC499|nr:recombinase family protein [Acaryochloris marina]QUY40425.1 recombinase family protein [Acaryochloris marina S15]
MSKRNHKIQVAIYLRVSTANKGQETDNQLLQLQEFCDRQSWDIYDIYLDYESGRKGRRERGEFSRLFDDAARRKFDLVLFWSLDRFTREGIQKTIYYLQQLNQLSVRFKSLTEPLLDTDNELVAHILIAVLSYLAQQEAVKISERTKAGLARVKTQGKKLGRPSKFEQYKPKLIKMRKKGYSKGKISRESGLAYNTVKKYLKALDL